MHRQSSVFRQPATIARDLGVVAPTGWRRVLRFALLVAASVAFSFGFACAVPFAAFGTAAALTLTRRDGTPNNAARDFR